MTYEEIRSLISEGEMLSCVAMKFNEGIKLQKIEIEKTTKDLSRTKKQFHEMELANGMIAEVLCKYLLNVVYYQLEY